MVTLDYKTRLKALDTQSIQRRLERSGFLPPPVIRRAMLAQRIPVSKDLLTELLGKFPTEEEKGICYQELVNQIDWQANPQSRLSDEVLDPNIWKAVKEKVVVEMVNYRGLIEELYPDQV